MKSIKILLVVLLAGLFVTGYVLTQDASSKSPSSCSSKKAAKAESCPVTGLTKGACPVEQAKMSPALAQYVASKSGKTAEPCCGTCQGQADVAFAANVSTACQSGCEKSCCSSPASCAAVSKAKCPAIKKLLKKNISMNYQGRRVYFNSFAAFDVFRTAHAGSSGDKNNEDFRFVSADVRGSASSASSPCPVASLNDENVTVIKDRNNVFFIHNGETKTAEKTVESTVTAPALAAPASAKAAEKSDCCGGCGGTGTK